MMEERGVLLAHTTILRWVQRYVPEFEKRWNRCARTVGSSWRMEETCFKVRGQWVYLYRAVDKAGHTVDFFLSQKRDVNAAKCFPRKAVVTISGIELAEKIRKDQFYSGKLGGSATLLQLWNAALAANQIRGISLDTAHPEATPCGSGRPARYTAIDRAEGDL